MVGLDNRKFITAKSRYDVRLTKRRFQTTRQLLEQVVSGSMPQCIVDVLKSIEIEHMDGQRASLLLHVSQRFVHPLQQGRPVCESGQRIMRGCIGNLGFGTFSRGDIDPDCHICNRFSVSAELRGDDSVDPIERAAFGPVAQFTAPDPTPCDATIHLAEEVLRMIRRNSECGGPAPAIPRGNIR